MEYTASILKKVPIIKENVVITSVGNECVIYPSYNDEEDLPYVITLDGIGTFILEQINGNNNFGNILENILNVYDVSYDEALSDLIELLNDLIEGKIIIWKK